MMDCLKLQQPIKLSMQQNNSNKNSATTPIQLFAMTGTYHIILNLDNAIQSIHSNSNENETITTKGFLKNVLSVQEIYW